MAIKFRGKTKTALNAWRDLKVKLIMEFATALFMEIASKHWIVN